MSWHGIADWIITNKNVFRDLVVLKRKFKLTVIWVIFFIGSFLHEHFPLPPSYFSKSKNIFNVYFVKIGWGWTFFLVGGYLICTLVKHRVDDITIYAKHLSRLLVETVFWYICTSFFEIVESFSGYCIGKDGGMSKLSCRSNGFLWSGFDISGHTFLLVFCVLIINEELSRAKTFSVSTHNQTNNTENHTENHTESEVFGLFGLEVKERCLDFTTELFCIMLINLMILWEVMLFFTCVYFHTLMQKLIALAVAVASYYLCYGVVYNQEGLLLLRNYSNKKTSD